MPLDAALKAPFARVDPIMYVPIALHPCGLGWHPEWTKVWQGWGPAYEPKWAPEERMKVGQVPGSLPDRNPLVSAAGFLGFYSAISVS